MATSDLCVLSQLSEEFLSCEICGEHFDTDACVPCILPCHHTFCRSCLTRLTKYGHFTCPTCGHKTRVWDSFPQDTSRLRLLELKRAACQEGHQDVTEARAAPEPAVLEVPAKSMCSLHQDERLKCFCTTCSKAVCTTCVFTMHRNCQEIVELSSLVDEKRKKVLSLCERLNQIQGVFQRKTDECFASAEEVNKRLQRGVEEAELAFSEIISTALKRHSEVLEELMTKARMDGERFKDLAVWFYNQQTAVREASRKGQEVASQGPVWNVLEQEAEVEKAVAEMGQKAAVEVDPVPSYKIPTEKFGELKALIHDFGKQEAPTLMTERVSSSAAPTGSKTPLLTSGLVSSLEESLLRCRSKTEARRKASRPRSTSLMPNAARNAAILRGNMRDLTKEVPAFTTTPAAMDSTQEVNVHTEGVALPDVPCTGCVEPIRGISYKCLHCPDVNLCEDCHGLEVHAQHSMLKLPAPWPVHTVGDLKAYFGKLQPLGEAQPGSDEEDRGISCSNCRVSVRGTRYNCLDCLKDVCEKCERDQVHPGHAMLKLVHRWPNTKVERFRKYFKQMQEGGFVQHQGGQTDDIDMQ